VLVPSPAQVPSRVIAKSGQGKVVAKAGNSRDSRKYEAFFCDLLDCSLCCAGQRWGIFLKVNCNCIVGTSRCAGVEHLKSGKPRTEVCYSKAVCNLIVQEYLSQFFFELRSRAEELLLVPQPNWQKRSALQEGRYRAALGNGRCPWPPLVGTWIGCW